MAKYWLWPKLYFFFKIAICSISDFRKKLRDWKCWGIKVYHNIKECTFAKGSFNQTEQNYVHQCIATSLVFGPGIHVNIFDLEVVWTTVRDNVWSRWTRDSNYCHWPQLWLLYIEKKTIESRVFHPSSVLLYPRLLMASEPQLGRAH